jgi:hypothetical protein
MRAFRFLVCAFFFCGVLRGAEAGATWEQEGDRYVLKNGDATLCIDSAKGGRIVSFALNGKESLHVDGSVFWPSPQRGWGYWPPPAPLDREAYTVQLSDGRHRLTLTSAVDAKTGFQVIKELCAGSTPGSVRIGYTLANHSAEPKKVAPWEVTRVPGGGLSFFPKATGFTHVQTNPGGPAELKPQQEDGLVWYAHAPEHRHRKLFRDGAEGWIAYARAGLLLVKCYPDIRPAQFAPDEAEVEVYAATNVVEVEQQGALEELKPGESLNWIVTWTLAPIPDAVGITPGRMELAEFARGISRRAAVQPAAP